MKSFIKKIIKVLGFELKRVGAARAFSKADTEKIFRALLSLYFKNNPDSFVVNVGAHDGKSGDNFYEFIIKYNSPGVMIEPQRRVFDGLSKKYGTNVRCLNVALGHEVGKKYLYIVKEQYITPGNFNTMTQIASFDEDTFIKNLKKRFENIDGKYSVEKVKTVTFDEVLNGVNKVDILQIDCEGFDLEVLKMFNFNKFDPKIINLESKHLADVEKLLAEQILRNNGYEVFDHGSDTCGLKV